VESEENSDAYHDFRSVDAIPAAMAAVVESENLKAVVHGFPDPAHPHVERNEPQATVVGWVISAAAAAAAAATQSDLVLRSVDIERRYSIDAWFYFREMFALTRTDKI
jgi:hypothetical protein